MNKKLIAGVLGAGFILTAAPAFAGEWRADRGACRTEIVRVNDGRGERYDNRGRYERGRYDNSRYDRGRHARGRAGGSRVELITICSRTSFRYRPDRRDRARWHGRYDAWRQPALRLSYDGRLHRHYRYDDGIRLYIRG